MSKLVIDARFHFWREFIGNGSIRTCSIMICASQALLIEAMHVAETGVGFGILVVDKAVPCFVNSIAKRRSRRSTGVLVNRSRR